MQKPQMHHSEFQKFAELIRFCQMLEELDIIEVQILNDYKEIPETIRTILSNQRVIINSDNILK